GESFLMQSREQEGVKGNVFDGHLSAQRVRLGKRQSVTSGDFPRDHGGAQFEVRVRPVRFEIAVETADDFLPNPEIHHPKSALPLRRSNRTVGPEAETQLAAHW